jgi:hypothetical protein
MKVCCIGRQWYCLVNILVIINNTNILTPYNLNPIKKHVVRVVIGAHSTHGKCQECMQSFGSETYKGRDHLET